MNFTPVQTQLARWCLLIPLGTAVLAYFRSLSGGFLSDDFVYVARFVDFPWAAWPRLFVREWSEGIWGFPLMELRPFAALSFIIDGHLWGAHPMGWRLTNLSLFLGVVVLVVRLAHRYTGGSSAGALTAGLVFALHPVQVEAVAWITGRVDLLAALAALLFWWLAETYADTGRVLRLLTAILALFVGVFSKEFCLLVPVLLLLSWLLLPAPAAVQWRRRLLLLVGVAGAIGFYAWCRHLAFDTAATTARFGWDEAAWTRQSSYVGWIIPWLPFNREQMQWIHPLSPTVIQATWGGFAFLALLGSIYARWKRRTAIAMFCFFGGIWWFVTAGGLLAAGYFSPRHLHFPAVGFALAVGMAVACCPRRLWTGALLTGLTLWFGLAQRTTITPWLETGQVSRQALVALEALSRESPEGSVLALVSQTHHWNASLWSWAAPSLAGPPFISPGWPRERVMAAETLSDRVGWPELQAPHYPARVAQAPALVAFVAEYDGTIRHRTLTGSDQAARGANLATLIENGLTEAEWNQWVRECAQP